MLNLGTSFDTAGPLYHRLGRVLIQRIRRISFMWRIRRISSGAIQYHYHKWHHYGFHNSGGAAEGGPPSVVEAAEGRLHTIVMVDGDVNGWIKGRMLTIVRIQ